MSFFGYGFLMAAVLTVIATGFTLVGSRSKERTVLTGLFVLIGFGLINTLCFWLLPGVAGFSMLSLYQNLLGWLIEFLCVFVIIAIAANVGQVKKSTDRHYRYGEGSEYFKDATRAIGAGTKFLGALLVVLLVVAAAQGVNGIWTDARAKQLANQVQVSEEPAGSYPDTDSDHIVVVPEQVARRTASAAMTSGGINLATNYVAMDPVLQSVKQHAYWIVAFRSAGFQEHNRVSGSVPGYIVVDAEDPNATAVVRTTDAEGNNLNIRYTLGGWFGANLERYVWSSGYEGSVLQDWTIEVDDQWRPFWTASTNRLTLNVKPTVPSGMVVVDAQSGEITRYGLGHVPPWVDRIYSAGTVTQLLNWWGNYAQSNYGTLGMFRSRANRYQVVGTPTLVYTKEQYPVWQVELTSLNSDTAVSHVALFDGRKSTVRLFQIPNVALESSVANAIEGSSANIRKLTPVHVAIHKIEGQLTWVAALVPEGEGDALSSSILQGVALLAADRPMNGGDIVIANSFNEALNDYQKVLDGTTTVNPNEDSTDVVVDGAVSRVSAPANENGTTVYYFTLAGDDAHVYRVSLNPTAQDANLEVPFIQIGTNVRMSYRDSGGQLREVASYDDTSMNLG